MRLHTIFNKHFSIDKYLKQYKKINEIPLAPIKKIYFDTRCLARGKEIFNHTKGNIFKI